MPIAMQWLFHRGENYKKELKKQIRLLITFTLGLTIAFTWRQTIFELSEDIIKSVFGVKSAVSLSIFASFFITIFSVGLIYLSSFYLREKE
ncbi:hypothetical protein HY449_04855 [Candidatus Pacearchaeota archaeon]|nr:hypothetical protein [Candidatus Pacearchaeota archaeon]